MENFIKPFFIHPFLFSLIPILIISYISFNFISINEFFLSLILVLTIVLLMFLVLSFLLKNKNNASFITTTGIVLFFSYGIIYNFLDGFTSGSFYVRHTYLIGLFLILWGISIFFFSRTKIRLQRLSFVSNLVAISLIIIFIIILF